MNKTPMHILVIAIIVMVLPLMGQTKNDKIKSNQTFKQSEKINEDDNRPPIIRYKGKAFMSIEMGKLTVELASLQGFSKGGDSDYFKHISESKIKCKEAFDIAIKTVKKVKAKEALKNFHIIFMSNLQGIIPGNDELVRDYKRRQQMAEERLNEAWARFEMEE